MYKQNLQYLLYLSACISFYILHKLYYIESAKILQKKYTNYFNIEILKE